MSLIRTIHEDYEPLLGNQSEGGALVSIEDQPGLVFNASMASDRRLRKAVYDRLVAAKDSLPSGLGIMVYEAYRPVSRQRELWQSVKEQLQAQDPSLSAEALNCRAREWVSDPDGVGSGHLFGCAVDVTLYNTNTCIPLDMGCPLQSFHSTTCTWADHIAPEHKDNRLILVKAMAAQGLLNYPPEWWHFSYGDRIWAILQRLDKTIFSPIA